MVHTVPYFPLSKVQRLYGEHVNPPFWKRKPYVETLHLKIAMARWRIKTLYEMEPMLYVDHENINECLRAIDHNTELIEETKWKPTTQS